MISIKPGVSFAIGMNVLTNSHIHTQRLRSLIISKISEVDCAEFNKFKSLEGRIYH